MLLLGSTSDKVLRGSHLPVGLDPAGTGDSAGCTRQTVGALEQGGYVPSLALAFRIARAFGLSVEDVFEFKPER